MDSSFSYYIAALIAVVLAIFVIKKVASCLVRTVTFVVAVFVLLLLYYFLKH